MRKDEIAAAFNPVKTLHEAADAYGISALARQMGKSAQVLWSKLNEAVDGKTPSLREAVAITHLTGDLRLLKDWCVAEGGMYVPLPEVTGSEDSVVEELLEALHAVGQFAERFKAARSDGVITPTEYAGLERAAGVIHSRLGGLLLDIKSQVRELPPATVRTLRHG